ncbi:MAG TPA: hypothetical protein VE685_05680 [Thermoanaerobaculia bacterium]|nr:hypothetical protein [Thermoanaerobaculia bacterium]
MKRKILYLVVLCCLVGVLGSAAETPQLCQQRCAVAYQACTAACLPGPGQIPCLGTCNANHGVCQEVCLLG